MAFCKFCGRELRDGEVCICQQQTDEQMNGNYAGGDYAAGNYTDENYANSGYARGSRAGENQVDEDEYFSFRINRDAFRNAKDRVSETGRRYSEAYQQFEENRSSAPGGAYERDLPVVDQCIVPTEEEIPVRQYNMAVLRTIFPYKRAEGRLQVTNKRVIFRATGKSWLGTHFFENEFALENIAGIEIKKDRRINFWFVFLAAIIASVAVGIATQACYGMLQNRMEVWMLLLGILIDAGGAAASVFLMKKYWIKLAIFSMGATNVALYSMFTELEFWKFVAGINILAAIVFFVLFSITEDLILKIKVTGAQDALEIRRSNKFLFFVKEEYTGFAEVLPWKDTEIANRELGALINDVKLYGNDGIAKWRQ